MRPIKRLELAFLAQHGKLIGWLPVFLGLGIGLYFQLRVEPGALAYGGLLLTAVLFFGFSRRVGEGFAPLFLAAALVCTGLTLAGLRANLVAEPVLNFRYYGPIEGRITKIDRSASDAVRLTLDTVVLARMAPDRTPARVRISLHGAEFRAEPGMLVMLSGHLSPPSGPVEPGGFNFQRMAWFDRLGAVGYTRSPVLLLAPAPRVGLWLNKLRRSLSLGVQARLPGEAGAFAAAVITGDRSAMGQGTIQDLRASNLAHLLAISGLHMGLLTGFIFGATRAFLALLGLALRWPAKKIAAALALLVGAVYLALSGGSVATERAFIMVAVMLVAVMLERRALTLRAVAIAALIVLIRRPEELTGPGFQMSFAATTALVAVFGWLRGRSPVWLPKPLRPVLGVFISSLVAGLATAPFAAAHFNQIAHYGLIANLASVPVMGILVMPAAVLSALLWPLGLASVGLAVMGLGLRWILFVAGGVAQLDGALSHVVTPGPWVLPLLAFGGLFLILWQGRARFGGLAVLASAFLLWAAAERPALLISNSGSLLGVMTDEGRALSKERGDGFSADNWLENDGNPVAQAQAFARPGIARDGRVVWVELGGEKIMQISGKTALASLGADCNGASIVILNTEDSQSRACEVFDIRRLRETGSLAGYLEEGKLQITSAQDASGDRLWNSAALRRGN